MTDSGHDNPDPTAAKASAAPDHANPYDVAPSPQPPDPPKPTAPPKGKIGDADLLHDFDEDADFDRDPAVEAASGKRPVVVFEPERNAEPFVKTGMGDANLLFIVAAVLLAAACVAGVVNNPKIWFPILVLTLWQAVVHSLAGVAAVGLAAHFEERPLGPIDLAAGRMAVAVTAFLAVMRLNLPIPGVADELLAAIGVYWLALWLLFRREATSMFVVVAAQFAIWFVLYLSASISAWASTTR